jgi:hypothetical protein
MTKILPRDLTSYDLLKAFALILMIIDHIGFYFFPDDMTWRMIGRFSAPIWLFLIGYAQSRDLSAPIWIWAGLLLLSNLTVGQPLLPLNMLFTIIFMRLAIDPVMGLIARHPRMLYPVLVGLFVLTFPTVIVFEYGAISLGIVMLGYLCRHQAQLLSQAVIDRYTIFIVAILTAFFHNFFQTEVFFPTFTPFEKAGSLIGLILTMLALVFFKPRIYEGSALRLPRVLVGCVQLAGRRSLEIFAIHLIIFKILSVLLGFTQGDFGHIRLMG